MYTVFPHDPNEMPQDFETYAEAKAYAEEWVDGGYDIEFGG